MKTIHWAMIGCGDVTEKKSGPGFYKAENSVLYGVTSRTLEKADDYAKRHHIEKVYPSVEALLADEKVDAVYIATPPSSHKEYALLCAKAKKVCYIEKPMALHYAECLEIIEAFKEANIKGFVAYYRRRLPNFLKVKELVDGGAIGDVRFVHVSLYRQAGKDEINQCWRVNPKESGGGIFMDMAVHTLDALDYIFGEIKAVKSFYANQAGYYEPEDIVSLCMNFKSGVQGTGEWCFTACQPVDNIEIVGSKGRINFPCFGEQPIKLENKDGETLFAIERPEHVQQNLIQSIVNELNGCGQCPSTLESAARTAWVCEQVYRNI